MNLNSLDIENNMLPKHNQKPSHFTNFQANMFWVGVRKKICSGPFLGTQELHSSSTLKVNVCIFLYISLKKFLFQRRSKILYGGIGGGWGLNNLLKADHCLDLTVLQYFIWIEVFGNSTISLSLCYSINFTKKLLNER